MRIKLAAACALCLVLLVIFTQTASIIWTRYRAPKPGTKEERLSRARTFEENAARRGTPWHSSARMLVEAGELYTGTEDRKRVNTTLYERAVEESDTTNQIEALNSLVFMGKLVKSIEQVRATQDLFDRLQKLLERDAASSTRAKNQLANTFYQQHEMYRIAASKLTLTPAQRKDYLTRAVAALTRYIDFDQFKHRSKSAALFELAECQAERGENKEAARLFRAAADGADGTVPVSYARFRAVDLSVRVYPESYTAFFIGFRGYRNVA